jgi:hypothetical protein
MLKNSGKKPRCTLEHSMFTHKSLWKQNCGTYVKKNHVTWKAILDHQKLSFSTGHKKCYYFFAELNVWRMSRCTSWKKIRIFRQFEIYILEHFLLAPACFATTLVRRFSHVWHRFWKLFWPTMATTTPPSRHMNRTETGLYQKKEGNIRTT